MGGGSRPRSRPAHSHACATRPPSRTRARGDLVGRRNHLAGRRAERRRRAAARRQRRQRRDDRRARPGLRRRSRLNALAGTELPPLERQHRSRSTDLRSGRARLQRQQLPARRVRVRDRLRHGAGRDLLVPQLPHADEFGQAVDYITNVIKPQIVVHSNSFLFGPFDGTGWFAQKVDAAAASGVLWVNSAGNYRTRHWEGAWSDADGDGNLDVPGDGNAFRVELSRPRPAGLRHLVGRGDDHHRTATTPRALPGRRADDARARQEDAAAHHSPTGSTAVPEPHATCCRARSPPPGPTTSPSAASAIRPPAG